MASDAGLHRLAADIYRLGIDAAREAGDGTLESNLRGCLAYQTTNVADPREGVTLALESLEVAGPDAPPQARALAWDRIAWAHARAHDAQATVRALGEAGDALAEDGHVDRVRVVVDRLRPYREVPEVAAFLCAAS